MLYTFTGPVRVGPPDGQALRVVHASLISNRDGIYPDTSEEHLREQIDPAPAVCYRPYPPAAYSLSPTADGDKCQVDGIPFRHGSPVRRLVLGEDGWSARSRTG
ncbi:MAG: hypothetical protein R3C44_16140 [Chloroflexota bacterium]